MRLNLVSVLVLASAGQTVLANQWFGGKAIYNKWHETELERWLSDHSIPYPTPADRKDLENLVKTNWDEKVGQPFHDWSGPQLQSYLKAKGQDVSEVSANSRDSLIEQVKATWTDSAESASQAYGSVKDWIFESWSDSQIKSFLDRHDIPAPQPRKRDTLIATARSNYESIAQKAKQYAAYPGEWLYETWSESDLKEYLDARGIPVPQPSTRDKLIASVRRNSRLASVQMSDMAASASVSAQSAQASLSDALLDSWSDSQIKEWADKNGIKVPQGSRRNELLALARKHKASLLGDTAASSASRAFGAATTRAGNEYAKATDDAALKAQDAFDSAIGSWSASRLKGYLDSRGVPVPQNGKKDELVKLVRLHAHKAATGYSAWTFDTWTIDNLKKYLSAQNDKLASKADASREELQKAARDGYETASKAGGASYATMTSYLSQATATAKDATFDTWSASELKKYLDSYGIKNYQGSNVNELRAMARHNYQYFRYGTTNPASPLLSSLSSNAMWVLDQLRIGAEKARAMAFKTGDSVKESAHEAGHRAQEASERASDKVKEEL